MKNKYKYFKLYYNGKFLHHINYKQLRMFCKDKGLIMDNMLRTLPNYPNEKRRNKIYRGYKVVELPEKDLLIEDKDKQPRKSNTVVLGSDKKEIDFINGKIRAEKIIHLNIENINERDILKEFNLDIKEWQIEKLNYSLWDSPNKEKGSIPLYSVKCQFKKRDKLDYDIEELKNIIDSCFDKVDFVRPVLNKRDNNENMVLIDIADLHLNKFSDDYDMEMAKTRFNNAIDTFLNETSAEECIFIIGEDYFNIDTINKTTTKGTPQDTEVDVYRMFDFGLKLMIETLHTLSVFFDKVNVILIQGNHDKLLSYMLVKALEHYNFEKGNIVFNSERKSRKYIEYGNSLIGLGHLDTENKKQKQFLMQNEVKEMYGKSKYNYFISGHLHNYSVEEIGGVQYIRLPSLSGSDNWHNEMGYITQTKSAIAIEFNKYKGMIKKIVYNV